MEVSILHYGMLPGEPGPCLKGNIELVNDYSMVDFDTKYAPGQTTILNMILLNQITAAEIARLAKNNHRLQVKICCNIFDEEVTPKKAIARIDTLTQRESVILALLAKGKKYREIAGLLNISNDTVKSHANNAYKKVGLHSKLLIALAYLLSRVFKILCNEDAKPFNEAFRQ
ncbi:MAG TPA: LuxR C-terminal-related transcriptional regulator [Bacteroidales bacterium]|nr:LuxR C-terminal-related transcriptional regulator [Bacteroidales bacterium]